MMASTPLAVDAGWSVKVFTRLMVRLAGPSPKVTESLLKNLSLAGGPPVLDQLVGPLAPTSQSLPGAPGPRTRVRAWAPPSSLMWVARVWVVRSTVWVAGRDSGPLPGVTLGLRGLPAPP